MSDNTNSAALDERALFEAAWRKEYSMPESAKFSPFVAGRYLATAVDDAFQGWRMARAAIDKGARQAAPEAPASPWFDSAMDTGIIPSAATMASASTELILPPLPEHAGMIDFMDGLGKLSHKRGYTAEQVRQAQRDAYELGQQLQKARIMHLTHERDRARACIDGRTAGTAPEGWKLVPIAPTDDMIVAFAEQWYSKVRCIDDCEMDDCYAAMIAAAPSIATKETP